VLAKSAHTILPPVITAAMKLLFCLFCLFSIGAAFQGSVRPLTVSRLRSSPLGEVDPAIYEVFQKALLTALDDLKSKTKVCFVLRPMIIFIDCLFKT
jgi:hypothetical protein